MHLAFHNGVYVPSPVIAHRALGDVTTPQIASMAATGAAVTGSILGALATAGSSMALLAGPIGAAVAGLVAVSIAIASFFKGCGQTCVIASQDANKVGDFLSQNIHSYMDSPIHYASLQAAALNNFDTAWAALTQACSDPQLGAAGQRCISDRAQGSCVYKTSPGGWQQDQSGNWTFVWPGLNGSGSACWNYFVGMRDPIANDPTVVPDPPANPQTITNPTDYTPGISTSGAGGLSASLPLLLIGGALLIFVLEES